MEIGISIIVLIAIWLIWSRLKTNKDIKKAFELVEKDKPVILASALREVLGYCKRNNLEFSLVREYIIVQYNQKIITIQQRGSFRLGDSLFFIQ
jgi:hypothetical protein